MACVMTKSPVALGKEALRAARKALPAYSSPFSPKVFTQHQLFAILVLRQFFRTDYRGIVQLLHDLSIAAANVVRGPCNDHNQFAPAIRQAMRNIRLARLLADTGYDGERNHVLCRRDLAFAARSFRSTAGTPADAGPRPDIAAR